MIASEYDDLDRELGRMDGDRPGGGAGTGLRVLPILVGVVSLLALGGIIWYAYSQGVREGSEDAAPLLRPDSIAKVAPDDPGGREIAGTNLEVYDRINGETDNPAPVEILLPPPEEPRLPPATPAPVTPAAPPVPPAVETAPSRAPVPAPALPEPSLAAPAAPPPTFGEQPAQTAAAPSAPDETPPAAPPAPTQAAAPVVPPAAPPAAPATGSAGNGWRIQLAALRSDASARAEWAKIQAANANLLGSLSLEVQQATVKGVDYFRVRGGPLSNADAAKALCAQLKAKNVACIPVAPGK